MKSVSDLGDLRGRRVLVRCDLNVPLDGETITDDGRIRASLPTLNQLREAGAKVIVLAHLGRPKGGPDPALSMAPVAARLAELLGTEVRMAPAVVGPEVEAEAARLGPGELLMLENSRFEPGETRSVRLTEIAGDRVIDGGNGVATGPVTEQGRQAALDRLRERGFADAPAPVSG